MASNISSINEALVDERVVAALRYVLPLLRTFSFGVDSKEKIKDDSVYVPIATDPTVATKTAGTMVTAGGTLAGTQVTLDTFEGAGWDAKEGEMSPGVFANYWADKAAGAVYACAKQVIDAALALITAANFADTASDKVVCTAADFGQADLAELWEKAEGKIRQRVRSLGLNSAYSAALLGESNLGLIFATANGTNFIQSGILPQLIGMNTWGYGALPSNSENLGGAVIGQAALLVGSAPVAELMSAGDGNIFERRNIVDPESGLSVLYTATADGGGTLAGECAVLYGVKKGQDAVVRLVSA